MFLPRSIMKFLNPHRSKLVCLRWDGSGPISTSYKHDNIRFILFETEIIGQQNQFSAHRIEQKNILQFYSCLKYLMSKISFVTRKLSIKLKNIWGSLSFFVDVNSGPLFTSNPCVRDVYECINSGLVYLHILLQCSPF